ncbi:hypothetical protein [Nocardiopsis lambiniae]|uniref:Uncharacterized protein n=1 Tax=Nocardiopsis lambiniae TaxID=3075539 RepID=A0ABU2M982_9ACTN|nr:hypothetical protein [Nocardiopsis sp. DSM 44743]MDT0329219.1 hypothetical protein [Nocardiopsis sp. DSM 44743]
MLTSRARILLSALLRDLPGRHHILTLHTGHTMSTTIALRHGAWDIGHPPVVERLTTTLAGGRTAALIMRTFTDRISHTLPNGVDIPVKVVRGWRVAAHTLVPLDEAEMFDAHCTDAASGEPLPPELGVEFTAAPPIDLADFHTH